MGKPKRRWFSRVECILCAKTARMGLAFSSAFPELKMAAPKRPVIVGSEGWDNPAYRFIGIFLCSVCRAPNVMLVEYKRDAVTWPEDPQDPGELWPDEGNPLELLERLGRMSPEVPGGELNKVAHILARWDFSDCS